MRGKGLSAKNNWKRWSKTGVRTYRGKLRPRTIVQYAAKNGIN